MNYSTVKHFLPNTRVHKVTSNKYGRLVPCGNNEVPNNRITFLGRFAEWLYSSKIQDVITISKDYDA